MKMRRPYKIGCEKRRGGEGVRAQQDAECEQHESAHVNRNSYFPAAPEKKKKQTPPRVATRCRTKYRARSHPPARRRAAIDQVPARATRAAESAEQLPLPQS